MEHHTQATRPLRIVVVDMHAEIRASLSGRLLADARVASVATAPSVAAASDLILRSEPDVVLFDPREEGADWRDRLREIAGLRTPAAWFLIAVHLARDNEFDTAEATALGADLFLLKGMRTGALLATVSEHFLRGAPR